MIYKALEIIKNSLAEYLGRLPGLNITGGDSIVLSHLVRPDGTLAVRDNTLAVTLVNLKGNGILKIPQQNNSSDFSLGLSILVSANYQNYGMALKYLSAVVDYFRKRNIYTKDLIPEMDPCIKKISVEFCPIDFVQQNHLWTSLGAKYIPSVLYNVEIN
jgi:hypothetical protein